MKRSYHSLLTKPVDLFCTNALIYTSVESFHLLSPYLGWPLSIILTTASFRLLLHPLGQFLDKINWKLPRVIQDPSQRLHTNLFLNDLESDAKKNNLNSTDLQILQQKIQPRVLARQVVQGYFCLNFARGLSDVTLNYKYHAGVDDSIFYFWSLTELDPFFVAPLLTGFLSFRCLQGSFHPFTLPLTNNLKFWGSFGVCLAFVPMPLGYCLGYGTFLLTHMLMRKVVRGVK